MLRLTTVRAKLLTLVALPVLLMCAALPVLAYLLDRQLIDEVDDRVVDAKKSLQGELDDDLATLTVTLRVLAADPDLTHALDAKDARAATDLLNVFHSVYPDFQLFVADPAGNVLAGVGPAPAPASLSIIPELAQLPRTGELRTIAARGCAKAGVDGGGARLVAAHAGAAGIVVVCQSIDQPYVVNAADKLGLELAVATHTPASDALARSPTFPTPALTSARAESTLVEDAKGTTWAVARFTPSWSGKKAPGAEDLAVVAALDVTDIKRIVRDNLWYGLGILLVGAFGCIVVGARLAVVMSGGVTRVSGALKKLGHHEYVKVEVVSSGDELEDLATGFNTMIEGLRERDKLRNTMGKYMTAQVMEHLMTGQVKLGGALLEVTILFTDIRGFTTISESMDAQALVGLLNEYFTEMVRVVMANDGAVDKYIGDAIMAVFGAPVPKHEDPINAVLAAVEMRVALETLNKALAVRGLKPIRTGIGIHTGEVVAGNIGSEQRMEYTVIGDAVNLASRLESNTKELGVDILISEATYERVKHIVDARAVREIKVKGREQPVMTYEVLGLKGGVPLVSVAGKKSLPE